MGINQEYVVVHADLFVRSMDVALDFYCSKLGFSVVDDGYISGPSVRNLSNGLYETVRLVLLRVSRVGAMIELQEFQPDSALTGDAAEAKRQTAWVSIQVADLDAHIDRLRKRGAYPSSERFAVRLSRGRGCEAVFYRDPDGNGLEFLEAQG
jgi:catechol 2,3-dioxygenase-like lactoylglutathione lyase family enzyme